MSNANNFTVEKALKMQKGNLEQWRTRLNDECYNALVASVERSNSNLTKDATGYDVARGSSLSDFVVNWKGGVYCNPEEEEMQRQIKEMELKRKSK